MDETENRKVKNVRKSRKVILISITVILVSAASPFIWGFLHMCGGVCPPRNNTFNPPANAVLLVRNFGPVTNSTPETHFQYQTINNVEVSYVQESKHGDIIYSSASSAYHVIVVERGYFAETGYKYGTDYEELSCSGDSVVFDFPEQFIFDIYLVPFQGTNIC